MTRVWLLLAVLAAAFLLWRRMRARAAAARQPRDETLLLALPTDELVDGERLARDVERALADSGSGELEEWSQMGSVRCAWCHGPDARRMLEVVRPVLAGHHLPPGSKAVLRRGPAGGPSEEEIPLG